MSQVRIICKVRMIFVLIISLLNLILGAPVDKDNALSVYDELKANCSNIEAYLDFAKTCNNVTQIKNFENFDNPHIGDIDTILCVLFYNSTRTYCQSVQKDDLSKGFQVRDICSKLPPILGKTQWKSLSTVFENSATCKVLCEETSEVRVHVCSLSYYLLDHGINKNKNPQLESENPGKSAIVPSVSNSTSQLSSGDKINSVSPEVKASMKNMENKERNEGQHSSNYEINPPSGIETNMKMENKKQNEAGDEEILRPGDKHMETSVDNADYQKSTQTNKILANKSHDVEQSQEALNNDLNDEKSHSAVLETGGDQNENDQLLVKSNENTNAENLNPSFDKDKMEDTANNDSPDDQNADSQDISRPKVEPVDEVSSYPIDMDGDSYFFSYFLAVCIIFVLGYVVYHNKQKILALIVEGRQGKRQFRGRRPNSTNYHKLDSNLEEAISSSCNKNASNVIY